MLPPLTCEIASGRWTKQSGVVASWCWHGVKAIEQLEDLNATQKQTLDWIGNSFPSREMKLCWWIYLSDWATCSHWDHLLIIPPIYLIQANVLVCTMHATADRGKWVAVGGCPEAEKLVGHIIQTVSGTVGSAVAYMVMLQVRSAKNKMTNFQHRSNVFYLWHFSRASFRCVARGTLPPKRDISCQNLSSPSLV